MRRNARRDWALRPVKRVVVQLSEPDEFSLDDEQVRHAQAIIDSTSPGRYTLRQMFGKTKWDELGDHGGKREYGIRFHNSYLKRCFGNIVESGKKSNSYAYEVNA